MTLLEILIQFVLVFGSAFIGWMTRGLIDKERRQKDQDAWRHNRIFLSNDANKN